MADDGNENEIRQEMLLDASAMLASMQVDTAFTQLSTRLNGVSASFETFNTR